MKFQEFASQISQLPTFNLNDARKLAPHFHRQQLNHWRIQNYIKPLAGGYYILENQALTERDLFTLANKFYSPSYISLESALAYYQIIPETVLGVTSVSARKTTEYESSLGKFSYRSIKAKLFFGYRIENAQKKNMYKMATIEKAVLDYLYLNSAINTLEDFEGLRWRKEALKVLQDNQLFRQYLVFFKNKSLNKRISTLMAYLHA